MSTEDVPGLNPRNQDTLHAGCWAEHVDGTLIYVLGTENNTVLYELFELSDPKNPVEYRDSMRKSDFEKQFTYDASRAGSLRWTWHDKTPFPWDRIMKSFKQGVRPVSAKKQLDEAAKVKRVRRKVAARPKPVASPKSAVAGKPLEIEASSPKQPNPVKSAAQIVAEERKLKALPVEHADVAHQVEREMPKGSLASRIRNKIQGAIGRLKVGE